MYDEPVIAPIRRIAPLLALASACGPTEVHVDELCEDPESYLHETVRVTFEHPIRSTVAVQSTLVLCTSPCCGGGWYTAGVTCGDGLLAIVPRDTGHAPEEGPFVCRAGQPDAVSCYPDCSRTFASWTVLEGTLDRERTDGLPFIGPVQPSWVLNVASTVR